MLTQSQKQALFGLGAEAFHYSGSALNVDTDDLPEAVGDSEEAFEEAREYLKKHRRTIERAVAKAWSNMLDDLRTQAPD